MSLHVAYCLLDVSDIYFVLGSIDSNSVNCFKKVRPKFYDLSL